MPKLRLYLYDQIRKLVDHGWVSYHEVRKTRGQQFIVNPLPKGLAIQAIPPKKGMTDLPSAIKKSKAQTESTQTKLGCNQDLPKYKVQEMLKQARLNFLTSLGETDQYKRLLEEVPELKSSLEHCLIEARDNSSKLLGNINALEVTLQKLEAC